MAQDCIVVPDQDLGSQADTPLENEDNCIF